MEQFADYCETDAKAVLSKHQRKVTRHRVDVLLFLMQNPRAFTFKKLTETFVDQVDRATIYRCLLTFIDCGIVRKAMNEDGHSCFFYKDHISTDSQRQTYLECVDCNQVFGLPALPEQYLDQLSVFKAQPLSTLLKGHCNRSQCQDHP